MDERVEVEFRVPSQGLSAWISTFYEMRVIGDGKIVDCLPPEWSNIQCGIGVSWELGQDLDAGLAESPSMTVIRGPTRRPTWVRGGGSIFGFGILPTGWSRLWPQPCEPFADRIFCLSDLVGKAEHLAFERDLHGAPDFTARIVIAETWLTARMANARPNPAQPLIDRLYAMLNDPELPPLEDIAGLLGISPTRFARLCKRGFGYPPKLLLRRQRFMRMLGEMHSRPYSEWRDFIDPLYVDQSHMIRDFRNFLGMSPTAYFALPRPILKATTRSRAAAAGKPYQILHEPTNAQVTSKASSDFDA